MLYFSLVLSSPPPLCPFSLLWTLTGYSAWTAWMGRSCWVRGGCPVVRTPDVVQEARSWAETPQFPPVWGWGRAGLAWALSGRAGLHERVYHDVPRVSEPPGTSRNTHPVSSWAGSCLDVGVGHLGLFCPLLTLVGACSPFPGLLSQHINS